MRQCDFKVLVKNEEAIRSSKILKKNGNVVELALSDSKT